MAVTVGRASRRRPLQPGPAGAPVVLSTFLGDIGTVLPMAPVTLVPAGSRWELSIGAATAAASR